MDKESDPVGADRRQWPRQQNKVSRFTLWTNETLRQDGVVLDESLTGIALLVKDGSALEAGQLVRLTCGDREAIADVKHVQAREDGKYCLGLEWVD